MKLKSFNDFLFETYTEIETDETVDEEYEIEAVRDWSHNGLKVVAILDAYLGEEDTSGTIVISNGDKIVFETKYYSGPHHYATPRDYVILYVNGKKYDLDFETYAEDISNYSSLIVPILYGYEKILKVEAGKIGDISKRISPEELKKLQTRGYSKKYNL